MLLWLIRIQQEDSRSYNWFRIRNDTLSGIPVNPADVILTTTISNPALTLNQMVPLQLQQVHLQDLKH
jgi:hypothetical protein